MARRYRSGPDYKPSGEFGHWLADNLMRTNMTACEVASRLHISNRTISQHITEKRRPKYPTVMAYCRLFENGDPNIVYSMVLRDHYREVTMNDICILAPVDDE